MRRFVVAAVLTLGMSGTATARSESGIDAGLACCGLGFRPVVGGHQCA